MATIRQRGDSWHIIIKRSGLLKKPIYRRFESREKAEEFIAITEAVLDAGRIPDWVEQSDPSPRRMSIAEAISEYLQSSANPKASDIDCLGVIKQRIGTRQVATCDYGWAESWTRSMKELRLAPGTIRHHKGALARCLDFISKKHPALLPVNHLRRLPKGYASYPESQQDAPKDVSRDRRLEPEEEVAVRRILAGEKPEGRQRAFTLEHQDALIMLFDLALESAMRLREMYTLDVRQVDIEKKTVFLEKTKNGSKRKVPLTSVIRPLLADYIARHKLKKRDRLFPWWDGDLSKDALRATTSRLSAQWAGIFDAAGCPDFTWHDTRHEATSRIFERTKLSDLRIAEITGHKDLRMLSRYANLRASDLADEMW